MKKDLMKIKAVYDWVLQWYMDFELELEKHPSWFSIEIDTLPTEYGNRTITTINNSAGKSAEAVCNESDQYNFRMGIAIAWAKLHNIAMPKELLPMRTTVLNKLKVNDRFCYESDIFRVISITWTTDDKGASFCLLNVWNESCSWFDTLYVNMRTPKAERRVKLL